MLKKISVVALLASLSFGCIPSFADGEEDENPWADSIREGTAGRGKDKYTSEKTGSSAANGGIYDLHAPGDKTENQNGKGAWGDSGSSDRTRRQRTVVKRTAVGAPLLIKGKNTFVAPANIAYQVEHHVVIGNELPKVTLDSFVYQAQKKGKAEKIYGDESTFGPPPQNSFEVIEEGGVEATTGHRSDAPSAWR